MLHTTDKESQLQILIGAFEAVDAGVAHAGRIKGVEGGIALLEQTFVQLAGCAEVAIHEPCIGQSPIHKDIRGILQAVFHATNNTILWLIILRISKGKTCHHLTIHRETLEQSSSPIDIGVCIALFLIAESQLAEGFVRKTILWNALQQFRGLAIVASLIIAIGEFHLDRAVNHSTHLCCVPQTPDDLVLLLLRQFLKPVEWKVKLFYSPLLTPCFCNGVCLLVIPQRLEGVKLLHTAVANL